MNADRLNDIRRVLGVQSTQNVGAYRMARDLLAALDAAEQRAAEWEAQAKVNVGRQWAAEGRAAKAEQERDEARNPSDNLSCMGCGQPRKPFEIVHAPTGLGICPVCVAAIRGTTGLAFRRELLRRFDAMLVRAWAAEARATRLREAIASALTSLGTGPAKDGYAYSVLDAAVLVDLAAEEKP